MARSYNGWTASPTLPTRIIEPVKGCRLRVRDQGDVATVFTYLVRQFHERVDDVTEPHPADDWGFSYRANVNNPSQLSCHSSGTALDLDATEHPNNVATARTFTARQISEVHEILKELEGVIRWGGDYTHTVDAMHFEIVVSPRRLRRTARKIRRGEIHGPQLHKQTVLQVAREVIAGKWGNGKVRRRRLRKAGYSYVKVQLAVRRLLRK